MCGFRYHKRRCNHRNLRYYEFDPIYKWDEKRMLHIIKCKVYLTEHGFSSRKPSAKFLLNIWYRFSAFWLRSKCSICSYQLNIWYEVHRTSSILNWFLDGDGVSVACYGSIKCWPCIAVPQGSAHFPTNYLSLCFICFHGLRSAFCIGVTIMFKRITHMFMVTLHQSNI